MISNLFGPVEGRKHVSGILADSNIYEHLQHFKINSHVDLICIYGYFIYTLSIPFETTTADALSTTAMNEILQ